MKINRRDFLKLSGTSLGGFFLLGTPLNFERKLSTSTDNQGEEKGILYDNTRCQGLNCLKCVIACKDWNFRTPMDQKNPPTQLSPEAYTVINTVQDEANPFIKHQCMHCKEPACVAACPVGALQKRGDGAVVYYKGKCIGCRYCMVACPFGVPTFDWEKTIPWIRKCTLCSDRLEDGLETACVEACPYDALTFGRRDDLIVEARARISAEPEKYIDHIYGENEAGGTTWMYLSSVPFDKLGFPNLGIEPVTSNAQIAQNAVLPVGFGVAAAMTGVYWLIKRRQDMNREKNNNKRGG